MNCFAHVAAPLTSRTVGAASAAPVAMRAAPSMRTTASGSSTAQFGVFDLTRDIATGYSHVMISGLTIQNGHKKSGHQPNQGEGGAIFNYQSGLTVSDVVFLDNHAHGDGGAISNFAFSATATLAVRHCIFRGNSATLRGGAIFTDAQVGGTAVVHVSDSELSGNSAGLFGGAVSQDIRTAGNGLVTITSSTISGNSVPGNAFGGGIMNFAVEGSAPRATVILRHVTLAGNTPESIWNQAGGIQMARAVVDIGHTLLVAPGSRTISNAAAQGSGSTTAVVSAGHNISIDGFGPNDGVTDRLHTNPNLAALADNGGPTRTHAFDYTSPAYNGGAASGGPATDQRGTGFARLTGDHLDVGAFELQGSCCGNGSIDADEDCDGTAPPAGATCVSEGFAGGGVLTCDETCELDASECVAQVCGNGIVEGTEECDAGNTGGAERIVNGTFDSGHAPWWGTGNVALDSSSGRLCADVPGGTVNPWDVVIGQDQIHLVAGESYSFSVDVGGGSIGRALLQLPVAPFTLYLSLALPDNSGRFISPVDLPNAQIVFQLGGRAEPWRFCVDNVSLQGGAAPGDCCSSTCQVDADGTACTDDGSTCTPDVCSAGVCVHTPAAPMATYASILCQLAALRATISSDTTDRIQSTLLRSIDRAIVKTQKAAAATQPRQARALKHAIRKVISVGYRVRSLAGRTHLLPPVVAEDLLGQQTGILASMEELFATL